MSGKFALRRRARVGAVVAVALLGLVTVTACGSGSTEPSEKQWSESNDQEQKAPDKQEKQASDTPSPTPEGPEEYAFVKKYFEEAIYPARKSGDTSKLLSMGTDDCFGCKNMAETLQEVHAKWRGLQRRPLRDGPRVD